MRESQLFFPVKDYLIKSLGCTEVHGEVIDIDVVGVASGCKVIVELKTSMSLKLLDQVRVRYAMRAADYMYVAVPKKKTGISPAAGDYLSSMGVGILVIGDGGYIEVWQPAKKIRGIDNKKLDRYLNEGTSRSVGGVTSSEMTSTYKHTIDAIQKYMRRCRSSGFNDGWVTVDNILAHVSTHYSSPRQSVAATLRQVWNESWCESKKIGRTPYFRWRDS